MSNGTVTRENIVQLLIEKVPEFLIQFGGLVNLNDDPRYLILRKAARRFLELQQLELNNELTPETAQELDNYYAFLNTALSQSDCKHVDEILALAFFENLPNEAAILEAITNRLNPRAKRLCVEVVALREETNSDS
jgi:flagellin-specific chaperone FliS